jgi:hypothetical protein
MSSHPANSTSIPAGNRAARREAEREIGKQAIREAREAAAAARNPVPEAPPAASSPRAAAPSSDAQIAANRANFLHSTGPTSDAGKARSSQNATTHGLFSSALADPAHLLGEERSQFDTLLNGLWMEHRPEGLYEEAMVDRIAELLWRLARINARGQEYLKERLGHGAKPAFALKESEGFMVEEARLERALVRITRNLEFLQRWRIGPAQRPTQRTRRLTKEWEDFAQQELKQAKAAQAGQSTRSPLAAEAYSEAPPEPPPASGAGQPPGAAGATPAPTPDPARFSPEAHPASPSRQSGTPPAEPRPKATSPNTPML